MFVSKKTLELLEDLLKDQAKTIQQLRILVQDQAQQNSLLLQKAEDAQIEHYKQIASLSAPAALQAYHRFGRVQDSIAKSPVVAPHKFPIDRFIPTPQVNRDE